MMAKDHYILGFNGSHDGSAALVKNGRLIGTATKERLSRKKKDGNGNDPLVIHHLLQRFNLSPEDIDCVAFCENYSQFENQVFQCLEKDLTQKKRCNIYPEHDMVFTESADELVAVWQKMKIPAYHIHHHLGHNAYSFYTSPFDRAVCVSLDGSPQQNIQVALANHMTIHRQPTPKLHVSFLYDTFTQNILGNPLHKAGSLMGLSAYGKIQKNLNYKDFLGTTYDEYWHKITSQNSNEPLPESLAMDAAATVQHIFENAICDYLNALPDALLNEGDFQLCLSGGSFLNCRLNQWLTQKTKFKKFHWSPACGDDGLAVGAALYCAHHLYQFPRQPYSDAELMYSGASYVPPQHLPLYDSQKIAFELSQGKVVGFFQGASEFGPRALGHRSLLADPRHPQIREHLNQNIKKREWYRPFGATVLEEHAGDWFDISTPSPFMLRSTEVKRKQQIPAVTHVDGTSRIQTLTAKQNPSFYKLIHDFFKITKVPMLLNTSLNDNLEPIVETPEDALRLFSRSPIDILVMNDRVLFRDQ